MSTRFGIRALLASLPEDTTPGAGAAYSPPVSKSRDLPPLIEGSEWHLRRLIGHTLLGRPIEDAQTKQFISETPGLSQLQAKIRQWAAADLDCDEDEQREMAEAIMHDTTLQLTPILQSAMNGKAVSLDDSFWQRVKNAWRSIRGKKTKDYSKGKKSKKSREDDEEETSTPYFTLTTAFHQRQIMGHALLGLPLADHNPLTQELLGTTASLAKLDQQVRAIAKSLPDDQRHAIAEALLDDPTLSLEEDSHSEFLERQLDAVKASAVTANVLIPEGTETGAIKGWFSKLYTRLRGTKPQPLAPATVGSGRLNKEEAGIARFLADASETELSDLTTKEGVRVAQDEERAEGEVTYSVILRVTTEGDKTHDREVVDQAQAHIMKIHVKVPGSKNKKVHLNQLNVRNRNLTRALFLDRNLEPGVIQGMHVRMHLSKYAGGMYAVKYTGRVPEGEARDNAGLADRVWAAPGNDATLFFVFVPAGSEGARPFADVLHSIVVYDKKKSRKEFGEPAMALSADDQLKVDDAARDLASLIALANETHENRAKATAIFRSLASGTSNVKINKEAAVLVAHALAAHVLPAIPANKRAQMQQDQVCLPRAGLVTATTGPLATKTQKAIAQLTTLAARPELRAALAAALGRELSTPKLLDPAGTATTMAKLLHALDAATAGPDHFVDAGDRALTICEEGLGKLHSLYGAI